MRYKVGDKVKLRDDLEHNKYYGGTSYDKGMNIMRNEPVEINHILGKNYRVFDKCKERWLLTDEMIEGLWEENKPKLKLIDILNKIANGELKEGTKVELGNKTYAWDNIECCLYNENEYFMCLDPMKCLNDEVELIEPQESTDNTKIEELEAWGSTTFEYGQPVPADWVMANKLNEVIRYINK